MEDRIKRERKLQVPITNEQFNILCALQHGQKTALFQQIVEDVCEIIKDPNRRGLFLGGVSSRSIKFSDYNPEAAKAERGN